MITIKKLNKNYDKKKHGKIGKKELMKLRILLYINL